MYAPAEDDEITTSVRYADRAARRDPREPARPDRGAGAVQALPQRPLAGRAGQARDAGDAADGGDADARARPRGGARLRGCTKASFVLADDETAADVLGQFEAVRPDYLAAIAATDPDARALTPPAPWDGIDDERPVRRRYQLVHQIEELARHAGHADILREQIDGVSVPALVLTEDGAPPNDFFTPYVPAPGTLGACRLRR